MVLVLVRVVHASVHVADVSGRVVDASVHVDGASVLAVVDVVVHAADGVDKRKPIVIC